jgi:mono/diheme cytochrome c family protein
MGGNMQKKYLVVALLIASLTAVVVFARQNKPEELVTLVLPVGNPDAGRKAFMDLRCYTCHAVAGETEMPKSFSANQGPTLNRPIRNQSPGKIATSIISPSHEISKEVLERRKDDISPMGDYSEAMTVRQLLDLLAYLSPME